MFVRVVLRVFAQSGMMPPVEVRAHLVAPHPQVHRSLAFQVKGVVLLIGFLEPRRRRDAVDGAQFFDVLGAPVVATHTSNLDLDYF